MPKPISEEGPSNYQEQADSDVTPVKLINKDVLICLDQAMPSDGTAETNRSAYDSEIPHQLLKETAVIKLQAALKWENMVDDVERDSALIAQGMLAVSLKASLLVQNILGVITKRGEQEFLEDLAEPCTMMPGYPNSKVGLAEINYHIVENYTTKFTHVQSRINEDLIGLIPSIASAEKNLMLSVQPSSEKVKLAVFGLSRDSSPGPNGLKTIISLFGFGVGNLLEKYLGISLVQGRVSKAIVAPLIENIRPRAAGWSGKLLFFQSRVVLVKSILTSLPIYNMAIYKWPIAAIKEGEKILRNFLWSGDSAKKKYLTIKWAKVCKDPREGGIGIHKLKDINTAMLMKLGWAFLNDQDPWAIFLRAKFQNKEGLLTQYYKNSSIWIGLKEALVSVKANSKWIIGSGKDIDFWRGCWGSDIAIIDLLGILADIWKHCTTKFCQIIHQNSWSTPSEVVDLLASLGIDLNSIILNNSDIDIRVWKHSPHGLFLVQSVFHYSSSHNPKV
ncbi:hypothetical protein GIB67_038208 [Kingdonia uniflora]|uniref:Uncharacterized protein n=1 Tax=Kingdonia uniflora TaxID=39325 RepID=A0A7J7NGV3_9MAGN|nr:hypothetical protein GIB67_038208 [Kingdonia uniflora]